MGYGRDLRLHLVPRSRGLLSPGRLLSDARDQDGFGGSAGDDGSPRGRPPCTIGHVGFSHGIPGPAHWPSGSDGSGWGQG